MNYQDFMCAVEERMNQKLTGGVKASLYTAVKNNGTERTGILIETPGVNISPTIYLEEYFQDYKEGKPLDETTDELLRFYQSIRHEKSWDQRKILTYEGVRDRIVFKLVNTAKNRRFLRAVPHLEFLDLSIVFYVLLEATEEGTAVMVVGNTHAEQWEVQTDMLWADAVKNSQRILPAEFFTMNYMMREMMYSSDAGSEIRDTENILLGNTDDRDGMYILSNSLRNYGAACIAYPHIMEMIGQILKNDYYILPSSVHEVVIVPCAGGLDCGEMDEMVRDINATQVAEEEVLSNHVYLYERSSGRLRVGSA